MSPTTTQLQSSHLRKKLRLLSGIIHNKNNQKDHDIP
jgi:hypothetical protein